MALSHIWQQKLNISLYFKKVDGKMTSIVKEGYSGKEKFDVKIRDSVISESKYLKRVYYYTDNIKTCQLVYKIDMSKIE